MRIKITIDPDGFLGDQPAPENMEAAQACYQRMITNEILFVYPTAEIEFSFEPTMQDVIVSDAEPRNEKDIADYVRGVSDAIYNAGKFWSA